mgnify:CR=1 FL=1
MIDTKDTEYLIAMRDGRNTSQSVFLQVCTLRSYYRTHVFCFFEGEDSKYYSSRIERRFSRKKAFILKGKEEVLHLYSLINTNGLLTSMCGMFFIDRDFDDTVYKNDNGYNIERDGDVFETDVYSIENYYVNDYTLGKILENEFNLQDHMSGYIKCIDNFKLRLNEFNQIILDFNALLFCHRKRKGIANKISFGDKKLKDFAVVTLAEIKRSSRYDNCIRSMMSESDFTESDVCRAKTILTRVKNMSNVFRGKNQFEFFLKYLELLIESKNEYFEEEIGNITIHSEKNKLTEFNSYAITSNKLVGFLDRQYKKLIALSAK